MNSSHCSVLDGYFIRFVSVKKNHFLNQTIKLDSETFRMGFKYLTRACNNKEISFNGIFLNFFSVNLCNKKRDKPKNYNYINL